jgi:uncharacterized repeat protein (TIGR01451 family)
MPVPTPAIGRERLFTALLALSAGLAVLAGPLRADEPAPATASGVAVQGSGPLKATIVVETLVTRQHPDGKTERHFVEAGQLKVGDEVYYTIRLTNPGKEPVQDVVVTKRLPYGVDYIRGSAAGPACRVEFSTDGGTTFAAAAKSGAYTHVRWTMGPPLAPGATALLRFRAIFR